MLHSESRQSTIYNDRDLSLILSSFLSSAIAAGQHVWMAFWYLFSLCLALSPLALSLSLYLGSDLWTDTEKNLFSTALATYGKDFTVIQKMVYQ